MDSIGNVNPEVRWGFDQRGRLKADTTYTGTMARATVYTYDGFERPSSTADPLGTWSLRYETSRGYLDTLITPYADTITYVFDEQSRAKGPYIAAGGGPLEDRVPLWNEPGSLSRVTHTVRTGTNWVAGKFDRHNFLDKGGPPLVPTWTEQHGAGAPTVTIEDSLRHDGWERITAIVTHLGAAVIQRDTFAFDRVGNVRTTSGAETYDAVTSRLLSRTTPGGIRYYSYDRAGNLVRDSLANGTETWILGYDALNRMRSARRNGVLIARYGYDVLGQRVVKRVYSSASGGTVAYSRFVYHGGHVAFETDSAGAIGLRYTWGPGADNLLAVRDAAGNHFYASTDPLGSIRGLVKRDGTWVMSQQFGAYGALIGKDSAGSGPGFVLRYAWTGRELDTETGLYFFRSRYYDPSARRFVQEDVAGYGGSSNLYAYGDGNPMNGRDPDGMSKSQLFYDSFFAMEYMKGRTYQQIEAGNPLGRSCAIDGLTVGAGMCGALLQLSAVGSLRVAGFLTPAEAAIQQQQERQYAAYLVAYGQLKEALVNYYATRDVTTANALAGSSPLSFGNFTRALEAVNVLRGETFPWSGLYGFAINPAAEQMAAMLSQGAIFINSSIPGPSYKAASRTDTGGMGPIIAFHWSVAAGGSAAEIAFSFAHEYTHWVTGTHSESVANAVACVMYNPSYSGCR